MGRRLSLILVMMLLASPAIPVARGQTDEPGVPVPDTAPPGPPVTPSSLPGDFTPVDDPVDSAEKPKPRAKANPKDSAPGPNAKKPDPAAKTKPSPGDRPALPASPRGPKPTVPTDDVPGAGSLSNLSLEAPAALIEPPGNSVGTIPPRDPAVSRTDGTNRPAAAEGQTPGAPVPAAGGTKPLPGGTPPAGEPDAALSADHIPLGIQSVAVTVDVQAPKSMNLNQETTLRLVVRNTGTSDATNVRVLDELPEGLQHQSSLPEAYVAKENESLLSWSFGSLPAGSEKIIALKVKPVKTGSYYHAATVLFQTASKAQTQVFRPLLKVDQTVSKASVLKGQPVEFKIGVTNIGDGPARNVTIRAKLSPGLRHGTDDKSDEQTLELTIPTLSPNQREELDPLVVDAIQGGDQSCIVTASSPDVLPFIKEEAECIKSVTVVEPKLKLTLSAPEKRFTDTIGTYEIKVENPGTAPARKVRVIATLPVSGRLTEVPKGAHYDNETRRLQWAFDQIEPGGKPRTLNFMVRMGGVGYYELISEARGDGNLKASDAKHTEVVGMPDVDLVVSERLRVVDVGGKTSFQIRLRNYGTKEATNLKMTATLSKNLKAVETAGVPAGIEGRAVPGNDGNEVMFVDAMGNGIKKLGPQQEVIMGITVEVIGGEPKVATCKVSVTHDDITDPFEDMARVKVMPSRSIQASSP
jgi:uncharacterized repeat protein (TIGR01451 family)